MSKNIDELSINTIRFLAVDMVERANSGHPGMPMGAAPMAYVLFSKFLRFHPKNPGWMNRDRFILSAGHGSALLYALLHLSGYDISLADLKNFRKFGSITPGHPEYRITPGVEMTTGALGQGFATGVGMALSEEILSRKYNRKHFQLFDHFIYGIVSDGDLMEGISSEAASFAGSIGLSRLIYLYDDNPIIIEGKDSKLTYKVNTTKKFQSYGWHVLMVKDGNDIKTITESIKKAQRDRRPSLIIVKTHLAYGSPNKIDTPQAHGHPLGEEEVKLTKQNLKWYYREKFFIPRAVKSHFQNIIKKVKLQEKAWNKMYTSYRKEHLKSALEIERILQNRLPEKWENSLPKFLGYNKLRATRSASGEIINACSKKIPELIGGSADLAPSTKTYLYEFADVTTKGVRKNARNIHFGVREHAMSAICNGMALTKLIRPFCGTFLVFSDYLKGSMRLSAMMKLPVIYIFTHDSIGLGEDGPTHQPIEHLASLRAIPNMTVVRPADANETSKAWKYALANFSGPTAIILTRQEVPTIERSKYKIIGRFSKGAYALIDPKLSKNNVILIATGSEVHIALEAMEKLHKRGISTRVVNIPSFEIFEKQPKTYKDKILPPEITNRISIEAGSTFGWKRYVGIKGITIGIDHFGASADGMTLFKKFGFTSDNIVKKSLKLLQRLEKI